MIASRHKPVLASLALSVTAALAAPLACAMAAATTADSGGQAATARRGWTDPHMATMALSAARSLADDLRSVETDLTGNMIGAARNQLNTSAELVRAIERMMPYIAVAERLTEARHKLLVDSAAAFYSDLPPIYAAIDQMDVYARNVAQTARNGVRRAEKQARDGNTEAAAAQLHGVADMLEQSTVYLPVRSVADRIRAAQTAIGGARPDLKAAAAAVREALISLVARNNAAAHAPAS
jgi:hypothetical protein